MIACFLSNISAKYYKNPSMLSRVIAKKCRGCFFLRHSVHYHHHVCLLLCNFSTTVSSQYFTFSLSTFINMDFRFSGDAYLLNNNGMQ